MDIDWNTVTGITVTPLQIKRASFFGPFAEAFVAQALRTVGLVHETTGYFSHQIQVRRVDALVVSVRFDSKFEANADAAVVSVRFDSRIRVVIDALVVSIRVVSRFI